MNAATRIIVRTTGALGAAAVACSLLVSAAPRIPPVTPPSPSQTAAVVRADRAALAEAARVAVSVADVRRSEQRLAARNRAAVAARTTAARAAHARAAAARAAAARSARHTTVSGVHSINVWTSGGQAAINACRGAVDLTRMYGVPVIAEHWRCGGASFPTASGSTVRLTGLRAGTYRVLGVVATLNAYTQNAGALPRGYQLLFQTCRLGDSHHTEFIALRRE
jgi:hypothetical protein